ncbi:MAG: GTP 3',8-cyclase MoaA [Helicobacter sp.]|nr:GTP 3',8-cyclase MoaA [Helicobacter sp.]
MLIDGYGRIIDYIRISVTQRCNFRCVYCMPNTPLDAKEEDEVPLNNILNFVKVAIDEGVKKIRITGGEPLLRNGIVDFIAQIHALNPNIDIALTTNAYLLAPLVKPLKQAGLKRINISLDSLKKQKIQCISKRVGLEKILQGIEEAMKENFIVKLNMVPLKNINEDEILDILEYGMRLGASVRFIEFMENIHAKDGIQGLIAKEILDKIQKKYTFKTLPQTFFGPATLFEINSKTPYIFGIIAPHNDNFCKSCNRIRLSSEGKLIPCLYHENALNIKESMLQGNNEEILQSLKLCIATKPEKNDWDEHKISSRAFYKTGG